MSIQKASKNEVRKEIADLINRIKEQSDRIGMQRDIPQLELDLILQRIEELHRKTVVWSFLNELPEEITTQGVSGLSNVPAPEPQQVEQKTDVPPAPNTVNPELSRQEEITKVEVPPVTDATVLRHTIQAEVFEVPATPEPVTVNTAPVEANEAQQKVQQLHQEPAKKEERKPLKDIKSFIGFNEKLMYIRQVFGGDSAAYEEALSQINAMHSHAEAEAYLSVLSGEYRWNKDNEAVSIFLQTVKRRFA